MDLFGFEDLMWQNRLSKERFLRVHIFNEINSLACTLHISTYGASTPNRTVWKILMFDFLLFLTFFSTHQKTLSGKFWNFFDHRFKSYRISVFRLYLLQRWSKFKIFFFFCFFYIRFLSMKILILFLKP